jgi:nitroreductase
MNPRVDIDRQSLLRLIKARRTVRQFDPDESVSLASLKRILTAGTWAPYAPSYLQGWKFIALKGAQRDQAVAIVTRWRNRKRRPGKKIYIRSEDSHLKTRTNAENRS